MIAQYVNTVAPIALAAQPFESVNAEGWSVVNSTPADLSMAPATVWRRGHNQSGALTWWPETLYMTKRKRQVYPNQASFTTNEVALNDYVLSTDRVFNATNNSTQVSPKPICRHITPDRQLVGNSVTAEVVAAHYFGRPDPATGVGKQVACVRIRANNGTQQTAWVAVSDTIISTGIVDDPIPVECHRVTLDISSLSDGYFWLEFEECPWIGSTPSVMRSEDNAGFRGFTRRHFLKNVSLAAAPPLVYVSSTGNDTTGVVSTNAATAEATPCLTIAGALTRARAALGTTKGALDGLRIRVVNTVNWGALVANTYHQNVAAVVIEPAPGVDIATAVVTINNSIRPYLRDTTSDMGEATVCFKGVTVRWAGIFGATAETGRPLLVQFWNCIVDWAGYATAIKSNGTAHIAFFGVQAQNYAGAALSLSASGEVRQLRGLSGSFNGTAIHAYSVVGCVLENAVLTQPQAEEGAMIWKVKLPSPPDSTNTVSINASAQGLDMGGIAVVELLTARITTTEKIGLRISADSDAGNITHLVIAHVTTAGQSNWGRWNLAYDDHATVRRYHKFIRMHGALGSQGNTKGDWFAGVNLGLADASLRTGNFAFHHGVGQVGVYTRDLNGNGGSASFGWAYPGIGSIHHGGDPIYVDYRGVILSPLTAGSTGGDYHLAPGALARDIVPYPVLTYDIEGTARGTGTQDAGCYA